MVFTAYAATVCSVIVFVVLPFWVLDSLRALDTLAEFVFGSRFWTLASSVLPTVAAYNVLIILGIQNDFDDGATWRKTLQITLGVVNVTVLDIWVVCGVVTVIMVLLIGYLSNVLPWNTAIPLDPLYLLQCYGNNEALKQVTLQTYHKQATVLVGRNGAGKTTLLNVIAGLQKPTSGVVKIYERDVATQKTVARVFLSYCPQHDLFFPDMTVWEHLLYFGVLVIIDEPTASLELMDARTVWETLLRVRRHCGLLFSTHNMTEADVLADRVIALSAGIVVCNASPTHLKNLYGVGYKMSLAKSPSVPFQHRSVLYIVKKCAPEAEILSDSSTMSVIALHTVLTQGFDRMFRDLESRSQELGIRSIGLTVSTLKDIYLKFEAWFNPYAIMSKPLAFDLVSSAVLAYRTGSYWARFHTSLLVHIPKRSQVENFLHDDLMRSVDTTVHEMVHIWALMGPLGFALVVCGFLAFPSAESCSGFMQLQLMTGISGWLHCLLNLIFDMASFVWIAMPVSASFVLFYRLSRTAYSTVSMEATAYLARRGHDVGFLCTLLAPCAMPMAVIKMMALEWSRKACVTLSRRRFENTTALGDFCRKTADYEWIYQEDMFAGLIKTHVGMCCSTVDRTHSVSWNPLQMTGVGIGLELYFFIAQSILLFVYISCYNSGRFFRFPSVGTPCCRQKAIDAEVVKERCALRLMRSQQFLLCCLAVKVVQAHQLQQYNKYALVAEEVHKWYGEEYAVSGFSLALPQDECFGLLGVYGCGKTSVAQMLAGLTVMSLGECHMGDQRLSDSPRAWQSHLGYCPEEDALMDVFTGYEVLELFARLRGVPGDKVERLVECLGCITDLADYGKDFCGNYSAGLRRKLSVAMALIGLPRIIILDDATRGIDLGGREMIYEALRDIARVSASAIIMTSRSTEECEMACGRVGVMAGGEVKVLGSVARLRELLGTGFTLTIALAETATSYTIDAVDKGVIAAFRGAKRADCREGVFVYHVTESLPWSEVFSRVEQLRKWFWLESVLIANSSLDELFLGMGRAEMAEDGAVAKRAAKDASYPAYQGDPWGREAPQKYARLQAVREARKKEKTAGKTSKEDSPP
ncbi:hypothetical protein V5799_003869 [Amblyomma americanum]|uniref:ABC transporter domain-containing protein n=1 Tax=Amblyomma americanum TaxID=6943 RepID=A0AAQ4D7Q8_AMBAM